MPAVTRRCARFAGNANAADCSSLVGTSSRGAGLRSVMSRGCDQIIVSTKTIRTGSPIMNSDASSRNNASALLKLVMAGLGGGVQFGGEG